MAPSWADWAVYSNEIEVSIRRARVDEAALLSDLALRSKAHWGYDVAFLEACRPLLTLTADYVATHPVYILEQDGAVAGFYGLEPPAATGLAPADATAGIGSLSERDAATHRAPAERAAQAEPSVAGATRNGAASEAELAYLFVEPAAIGRGVGKQLFQHAQAQAAHLGCSTLLVESDPHAAGFYRAMGGVEVGQRVSPALPGRALPLLRYDLYGAISHGLRRG